MIVSLIRFTNCSSVPCLFVLGGKSPSQQRTISIHHISPDSRNFLWTRNNDDRSSSLSLSLSNFLQHFYKSRASFFPMHFTFVNDSRLFLCLLFCLFGCFFVFIVVSISFLLTGGLQCTYFDLSLIDIILFFCIEISFCESCSLRVEQSWQLVSIGNNRNAPYLKFNWGLTYWKKRNLLNEIYAKAWTWPISFGGHFSIFVFIHIDKMINGLSIITYSGNNLITCWFHRNFKMKARAMVY